MTVDQLIHALEEIKDAHRGSGYWTVVNGEGWSLTGAWVDRDDNEELVVVVDN